VSRDSGPAQRGPKKKNRCEGNKCGNDFLDASGRDKQAIIVGFDNKDDCEGDESFELHPNGRSKDSDCEDLCPLCLKIIITVSIHHSLKMPLTHYSLSHLTLSHRPMSL
jgi:hypothetical protein